MEQRFLQYIGNLSLFQDEIQRICEGVASGRISREEYRTAAKTYNVLAGFIVYDPNFADFAQFKVVSNLIALAED